MEFVPSFVQIASRELINEPCDSFLPLYPGMSLNISRFGVLPLMELAPDRTEPFSSPTSSGGSTLQARRVLRSVQEKNVLTHNKPPSAFFHRPSEKSAVFARTRVVTILRQRSPPSRCITSYYVQTSVIMFFLFSSDVFVALRLAAFIRIP